MAWESTKEGWRLTASVEQDDTDEIIVADSFLKITLVVRDRTATYNVRVDQRRKFEAIEGSQWVAIFFGRSPRLRSHIKGQRLWRDKQIVVQRYGRKPRGYMIVAR